MIVKFVKQYVMWIIYDLKLVYLSKSLALCGWVVIHSFSLCTDSFSAYNTPTGLGPDFSLSPCCMFALFGRNTDSWKSETFEKAFKDVWRNLISWEVEFEKSGGHSKLASVKTLSGSSSHSKRAKAALCWLYIPADTCPRSLFGASPLQLSVEGL